MEIYLEGDFSSAWAAICQKQVPWASVSSVFLLLGSLPGARAVPGMWYPKWICLDVDKERTELGQRCREGSRLSLRDY